MYYILHMNQAIISLFHTLFSYPQKCVDHIGMYRIVTLALLGLVLSSLIAGSTSLLAYSPTTQITSLFIAVLIGLGLNLALSRIWNIPANHESALITALIMFFLVIPSQNIIENWELAVGTGLAILSKYIITYNKQHIFNPAVFGTVSLAFGVFVYNILFGSSHPTDIFSWWIANPILLWPVLLFGVLIVFKIRKWQLVLSFFVAGLLVFLLESIHFGELLLESAVIYLTSYPTLFLMFFMLTEPFTIPPTKRTQMVYGALVGVLSSTALLANIIPITPELALMIGSIFAYSFRIKQKLYLELLEKKEIAENTWEFIFKKPTHFNFKAGQYLEWMLPHAKPDNRGPRRYFTIASGPDEKNIRLALRVMPKNGSSYKKALMKLRPGETLIASQLAGDFLLPKHSSTTNKLGFIAGGIGVTPFSSHLHDMTNQEKPFDTVLYYCCEKKEELAYLQDFNSLDLPLEIIPVLKNGDVTQSEESGYITAEILDKRTPDWKERTWYISGPPAMVNAYTKLLLDLGMPHKKIKKDFFPGLA